jgi:hypothetical protein
MSRLSCYRIVWGDKKKLRDLRSVAAQLNEYFMLLPVIMLEEQQEMKMQKVEYCAMIGKSTDVMGFLIFWCFFHMAFGLETIKSFPNAPTSMHAHNVHVFINW